MDSPLPTRPTLSRQLRPPRRTRRAEAPEEAKQRAVTHVRRDEPQLLVEVVDGGAAEAHHMGVAGEFAPYFSLVTHLSDCFRIYKACVPNRFATICYCDLSSRYL